MKCNQPRPGFELVSPCPFPTTITITPRARFWFIRCIKNWIYRFCLSLRSTLGCSLCMVSWQIRVIWFCATWPFASLVIMWRWVTYSTNCLTCSVNISSTLGNWIVLKSPNEISLHKILARFWFRMNKPKLTIDWLHLDTRQYFPRAQKANGRSTRGPRPLNNLTTWLVCIYVCVYECMIHVCMCVCVWEREREREREGGVREKEHLSWLRREKNWMKLSRVESNRMNKREIKRKRERERGCKEW